MPRRWSTQKLVTADHLLQPVALQRARVIAPVLAIATLAFAIGVATSPAAVAVPIAIAVAHAGIAAACRRGLVGDARGHAVLGTVWWLLAITVGQSVARGHDHGHLSMIIACVGASVVLHTRFVVVSFLVLDAVYVPLALSAEQPQYAYVGATLAAQLLAVWFQRRSRAVTIEAEQHRHAQREAESALSRMLGELVASHAEREALVGQLAATARMEATGALAASFAHEMNHVLTGITGRASLLARRAKSEQRGDYDVILAHAQRGTELMNALRAFSQRAPGERVLSSIDDIAGSSVELLAHMVPRTVTLDVQLAARAQVSCDPVQIRQVIVNLVLNAADAMKQRGTVMIATSVESEHVCLRICDSGCGMDAATLSNVFDPFFTTKTLGRGTGLGLSSAWNIVRAHGGTIELASALGEGTTATVRLPIHEAER